VIHCEFNSFADHFCQSHDNSPITSFAQSIITESLTISIYKCDVNYLGHNTLSDIMTQIYVMTTEAGLTHYKLLNSGRFLYFKLNSSICCLSKINNECQLSFWASDSWVSSNIEDDTAVDLMESNYITCSLQQVYMWILENSDER